jgi:hypothetical protein
MIFELLLIYQVKHFLCDYPLQGQYMLGKFAPWPKFLLPLLSHSAIHGLATWFIAVTIKPELAIPLALMDMGVHFVVDRIKASPNLLGRFKALSGNEYKALASDRNALEEAKENFEIGSQVTMAYSAGIRDIDRKLKSNTYFWWSLGADQMAHHLTHYAIIWFLVQ